MLNLGFRRYSQEHPSDTLERTTFANVNAGDYLFIPGRPWGQRTDQGYLNDLARSEPQVAHAIRELDHGSIELVTLYRRNGNAIQVELQKVYPLSQARQIEQFHCADSTPAFRVRKPQNPSRR